MRLLLAFVGLGLASAIGAFVARVGEVAVGLRAQLSGWMLAGVVMALALYNLRGWVRRRPGLLAPWRRAHLWLATLSVVLLLLHTGAQWPDGILEGSLYAVFVLSAISGAVGAWRMRGAGDTTGLATAAKDSRDEGTRPALWQLVHYPATDVVLVLSVMHVLLVLHSYGGAVR